MAIYVDLNGNYRPSNANLSILSYNMNNIKESLTRLLTTGKGECPFNRDYGTSLKYLLFETNEEISAISMFLYMDITKWEPRISLSPASIKIEQDDEHTYSVSCTFIVPGLNGATGNTTTTITDQ